MVIEEVVNIIEYQSGKYKRCDQKIRDSHLTCKVSNECKNVRE